MASVTLPASVTMDDASVALRAIEASLAAGGDLAVDASALQEVDTAAVALLLQARRLAQARGVGFTLAGAPPKLMALAKLYGVGSLLDGNGGGAGSA
ncbi:STAS domain-containing protein [Rubrivivax albus]|uniref:STAS domain-containing protein n=1 Tax=Rubrivivax albus TaxID=2499835 RepID=A0A3S2TTF3_9BURK|nr:STAS domain-containing protein [Rubrivivax albus]RVT54443.1 STAS domain-containing protein [Rubrivivax albus]